MAIGQPKQVILITLGGESRFHDSLVGQELQIEPDFPFQQPGKRVHPAADADHLGKKHIDGMSLLYVCHLVRQDFVQLVFLHRRRIQENPPEEREGSGRAIQAFHTDAVYRLLRRTQNQMPQTARLHEEPDRQHQHSGEVQVFHPISQHPHAVSRFRRFTSHHYFRQHHRIIKMRQHDQAVTTFQPFPHVDQRQHERQHQ